MKFNLKNDFKKTFAIGSSDFKSFLIIILMIIFLYFVLAGLLYAWDFFASDNKNYKYKICSTGLFNKCLQTDRYDVNPAGTCVQYYKEGRRDGILCGEFSVEEN